VDIEDTQESNRLGLNKRGGKIYPFCTKKTYELRPCKTTLANNLLEICIYSLADI